MYAKSSNVTHSIRKSSPGFSRNCSAIFNFSIRQGLTFDRVAIAHLKSQQMTLEQLLRLAPTEQGIFSDHLRQQLWHLQHNPQLEAGYKRVVMTNAPIRLDTEVAFKLHSLGLVKLVSNDCVPSCDLYRQYFSTRLR